VSDDQAKPGSKPAGGRDWEAIEREYRAGARSVREIAAEFGVSHTAIQKRAKDHGWTRDLAARVKAKADALVAKEQVAKEVAAGNAVATAASEALTVEVEAKVQARIRLDHRKDIGRARVLLAKLIGELEEQTDNLGTFEQLLEALADVPDGEDKDKASDRRKRLMEQWHRAMSLGGRADVMKKLADTLKVVVDKEREAHGMELAGGASGKDLPVVSVRDLTGRK